MSEPSSARKILTVVRFLTGRTFKRHPSFYVLMGLKNLIRLVQPFIAVLTTPLLIDELIGARDIRRIILLIIVLIFGEGLASLMTSLLDAKLNKFKNLLDDELNLDLGSHTMHLDFQLTEDRKALDQLEKAKTGISWYSDGVYGVTESLFGIVKSAFQSVGYIAILAATAPLLLIVAAASTTLNSIISFLSNRVYLKGWAKLSDNNRLFGYYGFTVADFRYGKEIRLYNAKDMMVERWKKLGREFMGVQKWESRMEFFYGLISTLAIIAKLFITLFYTGKMAIAKLISIGTMTQLAEASTGLDHSLNDLTSCFADLARRCGYAYEYVQFMSYPDALTKGDKQVRDCPHVIEFKNVSFSYPGTDVQVLRNVNLTVQPGEHLSVVGLNGAGKTTLIKLLCRLYDPTEGSILMDGTDIREYDYDAYRRVFAPVFQDFKLMGFTVKENITIGEAGDPEEVIGKAGLTEAVSKMAHGADTGLFKYFFEDGIEPSGGEQQKIAIARALYKDAPVVILDEPTAALDPIAEYEVYNRFHNLVGGKTAFYISHRLSSCRFCDRIAVFNEGKIAELGTHEELVNKHGGIYAEMFEAQAQYYR